MVKLSTAIHSIQNAIKIDLLILIQIDIDSIMLIGDYEAILLKIWLEEIRLRGKDLVKSNDGCYLQRMEVHLEDLVYFRKN